MKQRDTGEHALTPRPLPERFDIRARFQAEQEQAATQSARVLEDDFYRAVPHRQAQLVTVELPETAHVNIVIPHRLTTPRPATIQWKVAGWEFLTQPSDPPYVYHLTGSGQPEWTQQAIVLRSNMTHGRVFLELIAPSI